MSKRKTTSDVEVKTKKRSVTVDKVVSFKIDDVFDEDMTCKYCPSLPLLMLRVAGKTGNHDMMRKLLTHCKSLKAKLGEPFDDSFSDSYSQMIKDVIKRDDVKALDTIFETNHFIGRLSLEEAVIHKSHKCVVRILEWVRDVGMSRDKYDLIPQMLIKALISPYCDKEMFRLLSGVCEFPNSFIRRLDEDEDIPELLALWKACATPDHTNFDFFTNMVQYAKLIA